MRFRSAPPDTSATRRISVTVAETSMLRCPRETGFVVVSFKQDCRSDNLSNIMRKLPYWKKGDGRWRILYEGPA